MKVFVEVKPVRANDEDAGGIVFQGNRWQCFVDDWRRYGWWVALYNLKVMLFGGLPKTN